MKQFLRHIFLLVAMFVATASLTAQTYNGGTWYSLYETGERTLSTIDSETLNAFTPVGTNLTFDAKKQTAGANSLRIAPIVNGSQQSNIFENGLSTSYKSYSATVSNPNSNQIKFYTVTGATLKKYFKNVKLPLAKHILLADGTSGTTSKSIPFGEITIDGTSNAQEVKLRSFLTTGNITISSNDNAFRIKTSTNTNGDVYAVGANACAASGGSGNAGGSNLGNIENYTVTIYFCPSEAKDYSGTITLTDGTSSATISVSGKGLKKNQSIVWSDKFAADKPSIPVGKEVSDAATATSGLTPIIYSSSDKNIIAITNDGKSFKALAPGTATITASQTGDSKWNRTSSSKTITVTEKKIQYIKWTDNLTRFKTGDAPFTMTATAHILVNVETEETQEVPERTALIKYTSANSNIVSVNGKVLTIVGAGETYVTATLEGDDTYERAEITMPVRVRNVTDGCERFVLDAPDEGQYSADTWGEYEVEEEISGPAGKLTFEAKKQYVWSVGGIQNVRVQQYVNGGWSTIEEIDPGKNYTSYGPYDLDRNAKKIRFCTQNGSYYRYFKNVLVTQATYVEPFVNGQQLAINEVFVLPETAVGVPSENTFELNWSTCDDEGIFLEVDDPTKFKVQPTSIPAPSAYYGKMPITVTCIDPSVANTDVIGNIIITYDGNKTYTQPVKCHVKDKLETWLEYHGKETYSESDGLVPNPFLLMDKNGVVTGAPFTIESSNLSILSIEKVGESFMLSPHCGGKVDITAVFAGSATHKPCTLKHTIDVPYCQQEIIWDQNLMYFETQEDGSIDETCKLTASVTPTYASISYELVNADFAEIIGSEGNYSLHIFRSGTGVLVAHAPEYTYQGRIYAAQQYMQEIRVHTPGECQSYALQIREEQNSHGWGQIYKIYDIQGLPENSMTFGAHVNTASTNNILYVDFSKDGTNWEPAERNRFTIGESYKWDYQCPVPDSVKYVRFETGSSLTTFFNMVSIRQKSYLTPSVSAINMPEVVVNQPFEFTFTVDYSDIPVLRYDVTNSHDLNLKLTPDKAVNNYCGTYGTYTFTLTGNSPYPQENITETIILSTSAGHNIEIPITITASLSDTYYFNNQNGNWHDLSSWTVSDITPNVLPTSSNLVIVSKQVTIDDHAIAYSIEMQDGGHINIAPTGGLTLGYGGVINASEDGSSITIENTPSGVGFLRMDPVAPKPANVTVEYTTRAKYDNPNDEIWQYVGAPGSNMQMSNEGVLVYHWSEQAGWIEANTQMQPFVGYALTRTQGETAETYSITAEPIYDNHIITLTKTSNGMNGDNLFVNSYLSPIDVTKFTDYSDSENNPNDDFVGDFERTFYLFNSGSWKDWQGEDGEGANTIIRCEDYSPGKYYAITPLGAALIDANKDQTTIPPMQGVYVVAGDAGGQIRLNYNKHVLSADAPAPQMNRPMRAPQLENDDFMRVRMQLNSQNSGADRMYLIQYGKCTRAYDNGFDARDIIVDGQANIYTNEPDGYMEISVADQIDSTYIGFRAGADSEYTLTFTSLVGEEMYLYDIELDSLIEVSEDGLYFFPAQPNSVNDMRFQLLLNPDLSNEDNNGITSGINSVHPDAISSWINNEKLYVANAPKNSNFAVYTASGLCVTATCMIQHTPFVYDLSYLPAGVYVLRLNNRAYKFVCE